MKRQALLLCAAILVASSVAGQAGSRGVVEDPIPLKDWPVPFEQIRAKVMETEPLRIAERSLHPSMSIVPSAASHFISIVPCRVVDTRNPTGTYGGPKLVGGVSRTFNVPAGPCSGIPASASAYSLNFTVLNGEGSSGFLTAYSTGSTRPTVSTLNYGIGNLVANAAIVPTGGASASIDVYVNYNVDIIIDINGYFVQGVVTNLTAGTGMTGGGTGNVTLGLMSGGVTSTQLGANAVTTGAIQDNAITAAKIAGGQVVKSINSSATDAVTISGINGASVTTIGSAIQVSAPLAAPSGSVILGAPGDTTLIAGGYREIGPSGLVEVWDATATTGAPSGRNAHTAIWTGTKMIVWGGFNGVGNENTGAQYDPAANSWSATSITGGSGAPLGRQYHTAVWTGTKMIVWGGESTGPVYENTGAQYDPTANSWAATSTTTTGIGPPSGRRNHIAVWTGSRMIVWGGASPAFENTGGQYDPVADSWTATGTTPATPSARSGHTALWTGTKMIVWGGTSGVYENTGAQYDPVAPAATAWVATSTTGATPSGRENHTVVWTGSKMIVWGGFSPAYENTGGQYNPSADSWTATTTIGAPSGRNAHTAVWTGTKMIVWGGVTATTNENTGAKYDPAANSWAATSTTGAPSARLSHTAVWTGSKMIVWGGYSGVYENSGSRWNPLSYYIKN